MATAARAVEYVPMYNLSLMGGQYFFAGDKSRMNANVSANVTPAVKLDSGWTLLPTYSGYYKGTKAVTDAVGSGTLFQQQFDNRLGLSALRAIAGTDWKIKPSVSYKHELLKETRDEAWGKGLFDYQKFGVGFEGEKVYRDPFSLRVGYDFYYVRFPNYQSLESKSGTDPLGNPLGRETAGKNVLDTINNQVSVTLTRPYPYDDPKVSLSASYSLLWQKFPDQKLVDAAGQYKNANRQDFSQSAGLGATYPRSFRSDTVRVTGGFQLGLAYNGSNQNTYDAGQTKYVPDSYSYTQYSMGPSVSVAWGDDMKMPQTAGLAMTWSRTQYAGRLVQDANGLYQDSAQYQSRYLVGMNYSYPVAPHFRLNAQANFLMARSNMTYEKTYKYSYNTSSYLFGFTYDY
ncbi:MAG: hypothetical protein WC969_09870 [Elusimicrobiota bacterium]|jgi:hypothetical protein